MVVFTLLFGQLAKIPTDGLPGPVFYFSALVPWIYFSSTVSNAGMSLVANSTLLTKIYFQDHPSRRGRVEQHDGLPDQLGVPPRFRPLLWDAARLEPAPVAGAGCAADAAFVQPRDDFRSAQREIPRYQVRPALLHPTADVRDADHLPREHDPGALPVGAGAEPPERRDRGLPLLGGAAPRSRLEPRGAVGGSELGALRRRPRLFQEHRKGHGRPGVR